MRQMTKEKELAFLKSIKRTIANLEGLQKKLPQIAIKWEEAEKNRKPRDPLAVF